MHTPFLCKMRNKPWQRKHKQKQITSADLTRNSEAHTNCTAQLAQKYCRTAVCIVLALCNNHTRQRYNTATAERDKTHTRALAIAGSCYTAIAIDICLLQKQQYSPARLLNTTPVPRAQHLAQGGCSSQGDRNRVHTQRYIAT